MTSKRESLWKVAPGDRPREKLERLGPHALSDAELVALVLGSGQRGVNVLDSAALLLEQAGGVHELMVMTVSELRALIGVGVATAGRVVAVAELGRRAYDPVPGALIQNPGDLVEIVRAFIALRTAVPRGAARASSMAAEDASVTEAGERQSDVPPPTGALPRAFVVVADHELRVLAVVPLAGADEPGIRSFVPRVLHEVLYRGGSAFAVAFSSPAGQELADRDRFGALRDVLKLASTTVGVRFLSAVVIEPESWEVLE